MTGYRKDSAVANNAFSLPDEFDPSQPLDDARREQFCQLRLAGMAQAKAHKKAGYRGTFAAASKMEKRADVTARVRWLQDQAAGKAVQGRADVLQALWGSYETCMKLGETFTPNAAKGFIELYGKDIGMFVDRHEVTMDVTSIERTIVDPSNSDG